MTSSEQPRNPLHGLTLERMLTDLVDYYGWGELGERIPVRCFNLDPSMASSLRFCAKRLGRERRWSSCTSTPCVSTSVGSAKKR